MRTHKINCCCIVSNINLALSRNDYEIIVINLTTIRNNKNNNYEPANKATILVKIRFNFPQPQKAKKVLNTVKNQLILILAYHDGPVGGEVS